MPQTILIVEDETAIADNLAYALKTDGFEVDHVTLGEEAIRLIENNVLPELSLIVLDVGLPDLNGFDVCRRIRKVSNMPLIFLTARSEEIDKIVGLEIGADDYVSKPFSPREVVARIRAILRRLQSASSIEIQQQASPTTIRFEHRIDEARILYFGKMLILTRYEYLLLKTFIERPGTLFSRAQLMDLVWHNAINTLDRTIDAHVKSIRSKLKVINELDDPILTHRGMGYSLILETE